MRPFHLRPPGPLLPARPGSGGIRRKTIRDDGGIAAARKWPAGAWILGGILLLAALPPRPAGAAVITTTLQAQTVQAWEKYVAAFERDPARPPLDVKAGDIKLVDLHKGDIPDGYIHHWIGAELIPGVTVATVEGVLRDYGEYPRIYPFVKLAEAMPAGPGSYDLRLITERVEPIGLHFAFEMRSRVQYRRSGVDFLVESRSYSIRESNRGHAPFTDLLPEGNDHGILWRLNSYWRLRQMGTGVYAECQAISLSRRPLFGTIPEVNQRARDQLASTLRHTMTSARRR